MFYDGLVQDCADQFDFVKDLTDKVGFEVRM